VYGSGRHKTKIYGGKLCENITQALARIVVTDQMLAADDYLTSIGGRIVLQVHDELVGIAPQANPDQTINKMYDIMRTPPVWASALPLDAEGGYADNYSK
jgi:DNA polymerase